MSDNNCENHASRNNDHTENNKSSTSETADETVTTDSSDDFLSEPLRFKTYQISSRNTDSNVTLHAQSVTLSETNETSISYDNVNMNNIQIPIVGYEIMEERARFTVFKLKIEHKSAGDCWYVFRRYTDFVRLCNRLRNKYPDIVKHLPRKRWIRNNFDAVFLEERVVGLQSLVNAILSVPELVASQEVLDFFCLNEPPIYSETNEESRAIFEALDETISELRQQVRDKDALLDSVQEKFHSTVIENENLKKLLRETLENCGNCRSNCEKYSTVFQ